MKYLGVILDPHLSFDLQVDYAAVKAKRAAAKGARLYDGRNGIKIQTGIELYKTLVCPHLEHAVPVWGAVNDKEIEKLQQIQIQCLKQAVGAKSHSSSAAVEVITGVLPVKLRIRELCCREFLCLMLLDESHTLRCLWNSSCRVALRFTPLEFIKTMSKKLVRAFDGCMLQTRYTINVFNTEITDNHVNMFFFDLLCHRNVSSRISTEMKKDFDTIQKFIHQQQGQSVLVYTDGSVFNGSAGCGACAAVLYPLSVEDDIQCTSKAVGMKVASVTCEIEGIILGMAISLQCFRLCSSRKSMEYLYILCDSSVQLTWQFKDMTVEEIMNCFKGSDHLRKNYWRSTFKFILCGTQHMLALNYMIKPIGLLGKKLGISILRSLQHQHSSHLKMHQIYLWILQ